MWRDGALGGCVLGLVLFSVFLVGEDVWVWIWSGVRMFGYGLAGQLLYIHHGKGVGS